MYRNIMRFSFLSSLVIFVVVLDQWTKQLVVNALVLEESIDIIPGFFNLTYIRNFGVAFGMFARMSHSIRTLILLGLPVIILIFLCVLFFWRDFQSWFTTVSLGLIISGAIGNLIDRAFQGYVVDFLDFNLGVMRWPAFNVADICVSVGGIMLLLYFSFFHKPRPMQSES